MCTHMTHAINCKLNVLFCHLVEVKILAYCSFSLGSGQVKEASRDH